MDVPQAPVSPQNAQANSVPDADFRLPPTPDYGTFGPGSDVGTAGPTVSPARPNDFRIGPLAAIAAGVLFALLVGSIGKAHAAWAHVSNLLGRGMVTAPDIATVRDPQQIDRLKPQKQAETLLEMAVGNSDGAVEQISSRVDRWQGKLKWNSQIATLTTAALNSSDLRVRESGIEVELAAYGLSKNSASLEYLLQSAESPDHSLKIWALWALGLMGNRGVETERIVNVLTAHLRDSDEDSRRWTVEGLALVGNNQTIEPLLRTMHDDASPRVRERAACALAEAGMFTREQRFSAVPQLLIYTDDPSLDAQTHGWAFQALADITRQHLPNDSNAWRNWYQSNRGE
jgi:HEAT repeat protein